jgi:hypothetical protein
LVWLLPGRPLIYSDCRDRIFTSMAGS